MNHTACRVSVVIKALNEEKRIACSIESALVAVQSLSGEVILADSCSTDRTVEIACKYPITIVQLAHAHERCCGIGPQLGYQHSKGEYIYILDGDMEMQPDFLVQAVRFLDEHPQAGGVGGLVMEHNTDSLEYLARVERNTAHMSAGLVDRLDMGGLYRRSAVQQSGYFSNRNLHSYEELDLASRLRANDWTLHRIDIPAVDHYGHSVSPYLLLRKRWQSRYINGSGEVVRAALGQPNLRSLLSSLREAKLYAAMTIWLALGLIISSVGFALTAKITIFCLLLGTILATPFPILLARKRSPRKAAYSYISLMAHCAGFLRGLTTPQTDPSSAISTRIVR